MVCLLTDMLLTHHAFYSVKSFSDFSISFPCTTLASRNAVFNKCIYDDFIVTNNLFRVLNIIFRSDKENQTCVFNLLSV